MSNDLAYGVTQNVGVMRHGSRGQDAFTLYGIAAYNIRQDKCDSNLTIYGRYDDQAYQS